MTVMDKQNRRTEVTGHTHTPGTSCLWRPDVRGLWTGTLRNMGVQDGAVWSLQGKPHSAAARGSLGAAGSLSLAKDPKGVPKGKMLDSFLAWATG